MSVVMWFLFLFLAAVPAAMAEQQPPSSSSRPITLPGCLDKCGNISIPFPFGVKPGCFLDGFQVFDDTTRYDSAGNSSDYSSNSSAMPVELMDISVARAEVRAYGLVRSSCFRANNTYQAQQLQATTLTAPFTLAAMRNVLVGVGLRTKVIMATSFFYTRTLVRRLTCDSETSLSPDQATSGICSGLGCCQSIVTPTTTFFTFFEVDFNWGEEVIMPDDPRFPCSYGMVVESSYYNFSTEDMYGDDVLPKKFPRGVPFVIDFAIGNGSCPVAGGPPPPDYACLSGNSSCANATSDKGGYVCKCLEHYDGNPYIPNGCQDIDECALRDQYPDLRKDYPCSSDGICVNRLGGYDCPCKTGMRGDGKNGTCTEQFPLRAKIAVGATGALLATSVCVFLVLLRREKTRMKEYFKKNGGPILKEVSNIKIFKKEELKPVLKSSNIVGKGAFGEVYKGVLDGQQVAVKRPAVSVDAAQKGQFANEVIIQSRIIHKNIVRLIGCCLEVDVPILVYEFVSKGSMDDILHGDRKEPLNLDQRLSIAAESAEGLAYMHSKTTTSILHGDVKPANILLNDEFVPKISDFGISRLIAVDKAQHTNYVIGDRSYMDPVYLQTGLLTKKSDVYSFGVVLLELVSRRRATYADNNSLVMSFLDAHRIQSRSRTAELFDKEITAARDMELLEGLAGIAVECLNYDVDQRPEMTEVAERLLMLRRSCHK
ncbi:hypothetical protein BS78_05G039800 [Paspalum vaginatum]|nr:hypothetical protein BS78_05G039800 [Paspalum vaginatum]